MAKLTLVPDEAAASVAVRVRRIQQDQAYIKDVCARYDGLKSFEQELQKLGIADAAFGIANKG